MDFLKLNNKAAQAISREPTDRDPVCTSCHKRMALARYREGRKIVLYHPYCAREAVELHGAKLKRI